MVDINELLKENEDAPLADDAAFAALIQDLQAAQKSVVLARRNHEAAQQAYSQASYDQEATRSALENARSVFAKLLSKASGQPQ